MTIPPVLIGGLVQDLNEPNGFIQARSRSGVEQLALAVPEAVDGSAVREAPCGCGTGCPHRRCCGAH